MRVMGQDPMKAGAFREYLRVLRALLHGEEVEVRPERRAAGDPLPASGSGLHRRRRIRYRSTLPPTALLGAQDRRRLRRRPRRSHNQTQRAPAEEPGDDAQGAAAVGRMLPDDFHTAALS